MEAIRTPSPLAKPNQASYSSCISNTLIGKIHTFLGNANAPRTGGPKYTLRVLLFTI